MAKLDKSTVVGPDDLKEYLASYSGFGFEMQVVELVNSHDFEPEHGGTYDDPSKQISRQFDIRATKIIDNRILRMALECKSIQKHFPLLVSCVPRTNNEAFHDVILSVDPDKFPLVPSNTHFAEKLGPEPYARTIRLRNEDSLYQVGKYVGKSTDQVGREIRGDIISNDNDVYGKWAQAIASSAELVERATLDQGQINDVEMCFSFVCPILVVPDGTLWQCDFADDGTQVSDPRMENHVSLFIDKEYRETIEQIEYRLSHLEIVTLTGLDGYLTEMENKPERVFPEETIVNRLTVYLETGTISDCVI